MNLNEMKAQRGVLDAQIREAEARRSADWNDALDELERDLRTWGARCGTPGYRRPP